MGEHDVERFLGGAPLASVARAFVAAGVYRHELFDLLKATATRLQSKLRKEDLDQIWKHARQAAEGAAKQERAKSAPPPRQRSGIGRAQVTKSASTHADV